MSYTEKNKSIRGSSYEAPPNLVNPQQPNLYTPQRQAPPQAETIMVECNRATATQTENGLNSDYHRWTCEFPNGIQLKTGDEVRVNSAYLSSIGVGDLISWDKTGDNENNKARWIHSFYCSNDGKNDKREGYNIKSGKGIWDYDIDNRPAELNRVINQYDITSPSTRTDGRVDIGWSEDPYMPMRFFGLTPTIEPSFCINETTIPPNSGIAGYEQPHPERIFWIEIENDGTTGFTKLVAYQIDSTTSVFPTGITPVNHTKLFTLGQSIIIRLPLDNTDAGGGTGNSSYDAQLSTNGNNVLGCFTIVEMDTNNNFVYIEPLNDIIGSGQKLDGAGRIQVVQRIIQTKKTSPTTYEWYATGINAQQQPLEGITYNMYKFEMISGYDPSSNTTGYATQVLDSSGSPITAKVIDDGVLDLDITVDNLAVGNNIESIQITFKDTFINTIDNLLQFNNYLQTLNLKIEKEDGTFEYITAYILKNQSNGSRTGTITHLGGSSFQLDKVRRQIDNTLSIPLPTQPIVNKGNNKMIKAMKGVQVKYALSLTKQEKLTLSQEYGVLPAPLTGGKIYYGLIGRPKEVYSSSYTLIYSPQALGSDINNAFQVGGNLIRDIQYQLIGFVDGEDDTLLLPHYEYFDYEIDDDYSSPSDIATDLTKQTHKLSNARDKLGNILTDTAGTGLLQNKLCIPVWSSFDATNVENDATGKLDGLLEEGSFVLKHNIYNLPQGISNSTGTPTNTGTYPTNGETFIYFRTKYTTRNRPTDHTHTYDFYQSGYEQYSAIEDQTGAITGFPIRYIDGEEAYSSQYCGTNNLTFSWDATDSRFNISYAHQPHISTFSVSTSGVASGGQVSAVVYYPTPVGKDNYRYKLPRTRCGGINIENWTAARVSVGELTPQQVIDRFGVPENILGNVNLFWGLSNLYNKDVVGERFWTKLGFSKTLRESRQGWSLNSTSQQRTPLGTTDNLLDVADSILFEEPSAEDTPFYSSNDDFAGDGNNIVAKWKYASRGGLFTNNHNKGYGLPNTSGRPVEFNGSQGGGVDYDPLKSTFNPDRNWWNATGYTIQTESDSITADTLPTKTELGYYFIMSDIIKTNFFVSKGGGEVNVLGTLSKLNSAGDFVFQYQAPQVFYAKEDRLLTSITTEIRTPSLGIPVALSPYSSVLYQIVRYNPQPQPLELPLWYRQQIAFNQIDANLKQVAKEEAKIPVQQRVESIMSEVLGAVNQPDEEQSTLMESLVEEYDRLELRQFRGRPRELRRFMIENPDAEAFLRRLEALPRGATRSNLTYEQLREQAYSLYPRTDIGVVSRQDIETLQDALRFEEPDPNEMEIGATGYEPENIPEEGKSFEERRATDYYFKLRGIEREQQVEPLEPEDMEVEVSGYEPENIIYGGNKSFEERRADAYYYRTRGREGGDKMDKMIVDTELRTREAKMEREREQLERKEEEEDKDKGI